MSPSGCIPRFFLSMERIMKKLISLILILTFVLPSLAA